MSADSSKRPYLVRETLLLSAAASSSARQAILVCDDVVDEEAPTQRTGPPVDDEQDVERPTIPSPQPVSPAPQSKRPNSKRYFAIETAAARLDMAPNALRLRCQRAAKRNADGSITADLGNGFTAMKLWGRWRIRFPDN